MAEAETCQSAGDRAGHEEWLVAGLRRADAAAQAALCERLGRRVHRYLVHRLGQRDDLAEELMVQTLVEAARHIARFDPRRASFTAWVFGIARRQVSLELRRQRRRKSVPESAQVPMESMAEQAGGEDLAAEAASRLQAQRQVAKLADYLSEAEMEALLLRCVHQLSVKEIGQVLGRSERAVDSLLNRAKRKARERLAEDG